MLQLDARPTLVSRVALGTAQLGMAYGVANRSGRPDRTHATALLHAALTQGLTWFDTAQAYGDSETVLGDVFARLGASADVQVVTKGTGLSSAAAVTEQIEASLAALRVPRLACWLLHHERELSGWTPEHHEAAHRLRQEERVGAFGVSVYRPEMAARALESGFTALQVPASVFDRRFLRDSPLAHVRSGPGGPLFIRSVYLQGLCLMDPDQVPTGIPHGREAVRALRRFCAEHGFPVDHFCLHYVLQRTAAAGARVVIGMETSAQLERNLELLQRSSPDAAAFDAWDARWPDDVEELVLPYRWKL